MKLERDADDFGREFCGGGLKPWKNMATKFAKKMLAKFAEKFAGSLPKIHNKFTRSKKNKHQTMHQLIPPWGGEGGSGAMGANCGKALACHELRNLISLVSSPDHPRTIALLYLNPKEPPERIALLVMQTVGQLYGFHV